MFFAVKKLPIRIKEESLFSRESKIISYLNQQCFWDDDGPHSLVHANI